MNSRISRGLHRVGVLAVLMRLAAGRSAGQEMGLQWMLSDPPVADEGAPAEPLAQPNHFEMSGMSNPGERRAPRVFYQAHYGPAAYLLVLAFGLYAAARAAGWVLDRFLSPSDRARS